jgi:hydroxymethylpyrimidine pyrophosphatase-like HAD family hydrolase
MVFEMFRNTIKTLVEWDYPQVIFQFGKEAQISLYCEKQQDFFNALIQDINWKAQELKKRFSFFNVVITQSHYCVNVSLGNVDKGSALADVFASYGICRESSIGIGDTAGDIPIRNSVGFFACPSNATPEIKKLADYISPYETIHGVLDILNRVGIVG